MYKSVLLQSVDQAKEFKKQFSKVNDHKTFRQGKVINIKLDKNISENFTIICDVRDQIIQTLTK
jgi:hypothetical protein